MRNLFFIIFSFLTASPAFAQYYYNNLVRKDLIQSQLKDYKAANIKQVNMISYDDREEKMEDFTATIQLTQQYKSWKSTTQSWEGFSMTQHQFNDAGQLIQTIDSSLNAKQVTTYFYEGNLLTRVQSKNFSRGQLSIESNQFYSYIGSTPSSLQIIQKGYDTLNIEFITDESGKITEEKIRKGKLLHQTYYYYYNTAGQLTDVVRYHAKSQQLLPDFSFEYNAEGKIASMLSTTDDKRDYQIWKYTYNEKGLKTLDVCTGKNKRIIGKVVYQYK